MEEHIQRERNERDGARGVGGEKINIDQAERLKGLILRKGKIRMEAGKKEDKVTQRNYITWLDYSRERERKGKKGGVEHVSKEWIKYVCLNKPIIRVPSLEDGRDKKEKWKGECIYITRIVLELIQAMQQH